MNNAMISAFDVGSAYFKDYILIPVDSDGCRRGCEYGQIQYKEGLICSYPESIKISDWHRYDIKISDYYVLER